MRTSSLVIGLVLTLGAARVTAAQGGGGGEPPRGGPGGGRGRPEAVLLQGITLTADQQARLQELGESRRKQMEAARGSGGDGQGRPQRERGDTTGMGDRRAQMEKRMNEQAAAIRAILTDEQRVQFDKNLAEMKTRAADRERNRP